MPEEIQVGRIETRREINTFSLIAAADPAIFDPRQTFAINVDGPLRVGALAQDTGVKNGQRNKQNNRKK